MTPGQSRVDLQVAKAKTFSLVDELRTRNRFPCRCKNICAGFLAQTRQVRDMIGVSVREENELYIEFVAGFGEGQFAGDRPPIKNPRGLKCGGPNKKNRRNQTAVIS